MSLTTAGHWQLMAAHGQVEGHQVWGISISNSFFQWLKPLKSKRVRKLVGQSIAASISTLPQSRVEKYGEWIWGLKGNTPTLEKVFQTFAILLELFASAYLPLTA